ncbi:MAG: TIR domain-containing anti-phage reverse transcriptase [Oceanospirillaceae bacterium]
MFSFFDMSSFEPNRINHGRTFFWKNPKLLPELTRDLEEVKEKFVGLKTSNDVADLLEIPVGVFLHILYHEKPNYNSFTVKKKSGQLRSIDAPKASIKILQNKVKPLIEAHYRVKKPVHGFVGNGKGIVSNAEQHKKKKFVLNIDLSDFFHSVNFGRVRGIFLNTPFNMGGAAATVLAQLCTHNQRLPQGASTSPVLSNLASAYLDKKLVQIARKYYFTYTRYADDITFSSNQAFPYIIVQKELTEDGSYKYKVGRVLEQIIKDSGFEVNHKKTRLQHKSQRQEVTGLVVNEGVNVNRKFIRKTRAMINEWKKNLLEAERRFIKIRYHATDSSINFGNLNGSIYKRAVYGHLSFIKMIKGEDHSPYLNLCRQVLELDSNPPDAIKKLKEVLDMNDIFICHASEDKVDVALPLYEKLIERKINTFIDCFSISWGDSLVSKINTALQKSKFVIAIISENSIKKSWPMKELNAVLTSEISSGKTKLLPLIVGDSDALIQQVPLLADKLFVNYDNNLEEIVTKIEELLVK